MKTIHLFTFIAIVALLQGCYKEPIANFEYAYEESMVPANVSFMNLSTEADKFEWNFGDGTTSAAENPVHEFDNYVSPSVSLFAKGRGGESQISKTVGITSYFVRNSSNISLYDVRTFFWDESQEKVMDDFGLGYLGPGTDSDVVITNHAVIEVYLELSGGTPYLVEYSYTLNMNERSYLNITDETEIIEVTSMKKGSTPQFDPHIVREGGPSITIGDLIFR